MIKIKETKQYIGYISKVLKMMLKTDLLSLLIMKQANRMNNIQPYHLILGLCMERDIRRK